jgi:glutamate-5-semialdehyde dehydrogenase
MTEKDASPAYVIPSGIEAQMRGLKQSARQLRRLPTDKKNELLKALAAELLAAETTLLSANSKDLAALATESTPAFRDRLTLTPARLKQMSESLLQVAELPDPVGEMIDNRRLENGLEIRRERGPLGVIFMIFESRPNVIIEAFSLAFKSGNVIVLRGGSESRHTANALYQLMQAVLKRCGLTPDFFYGLTDYDRNLVAALLRRKDWIDIAVPRGGDKLIEFVQKTALMPIIKNDRGLCHTFVDTGANLQMAIEIVCNAKLDRPGVCNALETVLVHEAVAEQFLPALYLQTKSSGLCWHVCERSLKILKAQENVQLAHPADWDTEYLDLIMNCRIVANLDAALEHIAAHGSGHSEAIVTESRERAEIFCSDVDAAAVYWNASTRFTDGGALGLGGELGISTQKLHVRGPVGLRELTIPRWIMKGTGQVRTS